MCSRGDWEGTRRALSSSTPRWRRGRLAGDQLRYEELHHLHRRRDAVFLLPKSMALVRKQDVLDWHAAALQVLHDLLGLDDGDVRIVRPVLNHQWRFDSI